MEAKQISKAVIKRLPRYYRYLGELLEDNVERISSNDLSKKMRVTASQIRQDLNNFGGFGQQGYGYNVPALRAQIASILGMDRGFTAILVGVGNIGRALMDNFCFSEWGFHLAAAFDVKPELIGTKFNDVEIHGMDELIGYLEHNNIDVAVLTVPKEAAIPVTKILTDNGIQAIWNFTNVELTEPNSPNRTHFMVEVSPVFMMLAPSRDTQRLSDLLPYKTLALSKISDRHGIFALVNQNEDRSKEIRKTRPSIRAQLKAAKETSAPKRAAKTKHHELEV